MKDLKVPLLGGGAKDKRAKAGVGLHGIFSNTPLHPSQEGNRTGLWLSDLLFGAIQTTAYDKS
jgi:hypothetical protein